MNAEEMKKRTRAFGLRTMRLVDSLPNTRTANHIGHQLVRSATSVGANYRAACRGRSKAEFIAKTGISIEEADESLYWMELLIEGEIMPESKLNPIMTEANELVAILTASVKTARQNQRKGA